MKVARQFTAWNTYKKRPVPQGRCDFNPCLYAALDLRTRLDPPHHTVPLGRIAFFTIPGSELPGYLH